MKSDDESEWKMLVGSQVALSTLELCCSHEYWARLPYNSLPEQMVVVIDGYALSGKSTVGERVAESIGGLLVDSARFYRAIAKAATESSIGLSDESRVKQFCEGLKLEVHWSYDGGSVEEAMVCVNDHCYGKHELLFSRIDAAMLYCVPDVRALVFDALRRCKKHGRLVVLGREIGGSVFPSTPFKFFVTARRNIREQRHFLRYGTWGVALLDRLERVPTKIPTDALIVDTGAWLPDAALGVILTEVFLRAGKVIAH